MKRTFVTIVSGALATTLLAACGGGSAPEPETVADDPCSIDGQKQFVLDAMNDWYLWNDLLPVNVNLDAYSSPEELLDFLTSVQPLDNFSFIAIAAEDSAFFGEGQFEGFGFNSRFVNSTELRLSRVFVDSPAYRAGLRRGQEVVTLNGVNVADIPDLGAVFDLTTVTFGMRETNGTEFTVDITQDIVTIDPVPQYRIIDAGNGRNVAYLELATFISTANDQLDAAFAEFRAANVQELILDLRYNGGGLVSTANQLGDLLGGLNNDGLEFSETLYNEERAPTRNSREFFELRAASMDLQRLVVIASRGTASASELVTNSMDPYVVTGIVGDRTFGKPVGQVGLGFCEKVLRPTSFQTVNAADFGDYFDGLPADCLAADDLDIPVGDDADPRVIAALQYLDNQTCPVAAGPSGVSKPTPLVEEQRRSRNYGEPHRDLLDAY